ncbi:uncharacterized protein LOC112271633 [Brachypodium distachyon]|uniref:uncharacterized protein LOC112271633 n=1 Tax=Brachypodium distachyon TaxID=15368 RepID=UPI000D0D6761|nr:uncharacterized protein LOC112271633 [Brachypodium distachyon]|eukprot:XP_024317124.1 uncharacterized protein LOC112271633 [Brachypodium distachyon]
MSARLSYFMSLQDNDKPLDLGPCRDPSTKVADSPANAAEALDQFEFFRSSRGRFDTRLARSCAGKSNPSSWWLMFGGEVRILQGYAIRILSQCMSSSGCERNWSTFALMHAEAKNRLFTEKLHKLVYVRYNLKLRSEQTKIHTEEKDGEEENVLDPCRMMMAVTLYDKENPVMDWLNMPDSVSLTPQDEATPCRALVDMMHTETSCEYALNKPIGASGSKGKDMLDGTKRKRKKGKISANDDGPRHAMCTRNKTKGLPGLG